MKICTGYSKYFNKKHDRVGPVFQDSFKAVRVSKNNQLLWVNYYIHKNPVESGLVEKSEDYKWSSALEYKDLVSEPLCKKEIIAEQSKQITEKEMESELISNLDLLIDY